MNKYANKITKSIGKGMYQTFQDAILTIKRADLDIIQNFTGNNYTDIQKQLILGKNTSATKKLEALFKQMPRLKKKLIVYRVFSRKYLKSGRYKTYLSTSLTREAMMYHAKKMNPNDVYITKVVVYPGVKILPIFDLSRFKKEKEVLLDRNQKIHIHMLNGKSLLDAVVHIYPKNIKLSVEEKLSHSGGIKKNRELTKLKPKLIRKSV